MNKVNLKVGQTVEVFVIGEDEVVGEVLSVSSEGGYLRLTNIQGSKNLRAVKIYYASEIQHIKILKDPADIPDSSLTNAEPQPALTTKQLSNYALESALEKIEKCVFIDKIDEQYYEFIDCLKQQRVFGAFIECIKTGQNDKSPSLLSFVTYDWIYIYDIKSLQMTKDVSDLLSDGNNIPVIHNGRIIKDVLKRSYGTVLGKCFDILVAVIDIEKTERKVQEDSVIYPQHSIQYCVEKFVKLPEKFFDEDVDFDERPMKNESKLAAAKNVAFLMELHDHIVHEILLERFYRISKIHADKKKCADHVDSFKMRMRQSITKREIIPFSLPIYEKLDENQMK